ncbi:MAG: hypothetical protein ACOYNN_15920, partial [Terrimicrobiaceae bacterium]
IVRASSPVLAVSVNAPPAVSDRIPLPVILFADENTATLFTEPEIAVFIEDEIDPVMNKKLLSSSVYVSGDPFWSLKVSEVAGIIW